MESTSCAKFSAIPDGRLNPADRSRSESLPLSAGHVKTTRHEIRVLTQASSRASPSQVWKLPLRQAMLVSNSVHTILALRLTLAIAHTTQRRVITDAICLL